MVLTAFSDGDQTKPKLDTDPNEKPKAVDIDPPPPWHLVDIDWQEFHEHEKSLEFVLVSTLTVDVSILTDVEKNAPYFISPLTSAIRTQFFLRRIYNCSTHH